MERKPEWLRVRLSNTQHYSSVNEVIRNRKLNTVCAGANCPNRVKCYSEKTATFMILGEECTRGCKFCNIKKGTLQPPDPTEPERVGLGIKDLGLAHAVITSVTRDDLDDGGAAHFAATVASIKAHAPDTTIELLIPDMQGCKDDLDTVMASKPHVLNHNIETVARLYSDVRPEANYQQSLEVLKYVKEHYPEVITKSGLMLGLGETLDEVIKVMEDLRKAKVDVLTMGQYLQPSKDHFQMVAYIEPTVFDQLAEKAYALGFRAVASGPLVRSSYYAKDLYENLA